jgi:hypothetical protein
LPLPNANNNNIIVDSNKARNTGNLNNFCGYCLPTNTSLISFESSHQIPQRQQQQEVLITGGKRAGFKSLFVECEKEVRDCVKEYSLLNQSRDSATKSLLLTHAKGTFETRIMVRVIYVLFIWKTSRVKFEEKNYSFLEKSRQAWCAGVFT